jgi:hypothetical protein
VCCCVITITVQPASSWRRSRQIAQKRPVLCQLFNRRSRYRVRLVRGSQLHVHAGGHRSLHQWGAAALQVHRDALADVAFGPADVVAGVLVGGLEVQDVDRARDVVAEAELLWVLTDGWHGAPD